MSNCYVDLINLFTTRYFHPAPLVARNLTPDAVWHAFIDFDNEIANTSTQAAVWCSSSVSMARTPLGSRQFRTLGPVIAFSRFAAPGAGGDQIRDWARELAVTTLLDQLIATLPAGVKYPNDLI